VSSTWYRRAALETRNVVVTALAGLLLVAVLVGAVVLITAIAVR
jgi:hypothetical protein